MYLMEIAVSVEKACIRQNFRLTRTNQRLCDNKKLITFNYPEIVSLMQIYTQSARDACVRPKYLRLGEPELNLLPTTQQWSYLACCAPPSRRYLPLLCVVDMTKLDFMRLTKFNKYKWRAVPALEMMGQAERGGIYLARV